MKSNALFSIGCKEIISNKKYVVSWQQNDLNPQRIHRGKIASGAMQLSRIFAF